MDTMKFLILAFSVLMIGCQAKDESPVQTDDSRHFIQPRPVELMVTYHLEGIRPLRSHRVSLQEFSEKRVSWEMERKSDEAVLLLYAGRMQDYPNQREVQHLSIEPHPDTTVSRDIDGNVIDFWIFPRLPKIAGRSVLRAV